MIPSAGSYNSDIQTEDSRKEGGLLQSLPEGLSIARLPCRARGRFRSGSIEEECLPQRQESLKSLSRQDCFSSITFPPSFPIFLVERFLPKDLEKSLRIAKNPPR
jgi:hypothetical protein